MNIGGKEYALTAQTDQEKMLGTCVGCAFESVELVQYCCEVVSCAFNIGEVYKEVTK